MLLRRKCDPDPIAIRRYIRRRDRWMIWMGGAGQGMGCEWLPGLVWEGLGGLGLGCEWLAGLVSRVYVYVDWRGWGRSGAGL